MEEESLAQRTADKIRNMILIENVYKFGDKLPNENVLSEKFKVSRTTLREAVHILISEGLLNVQRGKGTFVVNQMERQTDSGIDLQELHSKKVTLRDLYETRLIFEPEAAALACKRASDEEIAHILVLGEQCQEHLKKSYTGKQRIESEVAFHGALIKASHNEFISQFLPVLTATIEKTFDLDHKLYIIAKDAYEDHAMIMKFLEQRNSEAVKCAIKIHLSNAIHTEELE